MILLQGHIGFAIFFIGGTLLTMLLGTVGFWIYLSYTSPKAPSSSLIFRYLKRLGQSIGLATLLTIAVVFFAIIMLLLVQKCRS